MSTVFGFIFVYWFLINVKLLYRFSRGLSEKVTAKGDFMRGLLKCASKQKEQSFAQQNINFSVVSQPFHIYN